MLGVAGPWLRAAYTAFLLRPANPTRPLLARSSFITSTTQAPAKLLIRAADHRHITASRALYTQHTALRPAIRPVKTMSFAGLAARPHRFHEMPPSRPAHHCRLEATQIPTIDVHRTSYDDGRKEVHALSFCADLLYTLHMPRV